MYVYTYSTSVSFSISYFYHDCVVLFCSQREPVKFDVHLQGAPIEVVQLVQNIKDVSLSRCLVCCNVRLAHIGSIKQ